MTDYVALWKCLIANPHDSAPKYILADWYYEHDDELMGDGLAWAARNRRMPAHDNQTYSWRWSLFDAGPEDSIGLVRRMFGPQPHELELPIFDLLCLGEKSRQAKSFRFRDPLVAFWRLSQALYLYEQHLESLKIPDQPNSSRKARLP